MLFDERLSSTHSEHTEDSSLLGNDALNKRTIQTINKLYDIISILITSIDTLTDIILVIHFYYTPHQTILFAFGLGFLLLSHLCYVTLALVTFGSSLNNVQRLICLLCLIPISPLLPYLIYWASLPDAWLNSMIGSFSLDQVDWNLSTQSFKPSNWKKFVDEKLTTNIAFIMQSLVESLPFSIIQIVAIVSYQRSNYNHHLLLVSVTFSLLSIVYKSILFASGVSIRASIFKWMCIFIDFYATLFVSIGWAFFNINNDHSSNMGGIPDGDFFGLINLDGISWLGYLYIYKILFLVAPIVTLIVIVLLFELSYDNISDFLCWKSRNYAFLLLCYVPFVIVVVSIVFCFSVVLATIIAEFACCSWFAWFVELYFNERYKWLKKGIFWDIIVKQFLLIDTTNQRDLVLRLLVVNYILSQTTESEWVKRMFIDFNSWMAINEYRVFHVNLSNSHEMVLKDLRSQFRDSTGKHSLTMIGSVFRLYSVQISNLHLEIDSFCVNIALFFILFIGIPSYIVSRIMTVIFPFWCIAYILLNGTNIYLPLWKHLDVNDINFDQIPSFCLCTTIFYGISLICLFVVGMRLYALMKILWHIMPGRQTLVKSLIVERNKNEYLTQLNAMYSFHKHKSLIYSGLCKKFSNDVGSIISEYLPRTFVEQCEISNNDQELEYDEKRGRRRHGSIISSSTPHLAIDCVDPLPPRFGYFDRYPYNISERETDSEDEKYLINMTIPPPLTIPVDCDDPLTLLNKQTSTKRVAHSY